MRSALDSDGLLVSADDAEKNITYYCPVTTQPVRLKRGPVRAAHFFHLESTPECRASEKTYLHAMIQEWIWERLPGEEKAIEKGFAEIGRIADVVSFDLRAVFEVQISPITEAERRARRADYAKVGLDLVWILHERRFKEHKVRGDPFDYFTDLDDEGRGAIYDPQTGPIDLSSALRYNGQLYFRGDRIWEAMATGSTPTKKSRYHRALLALAKSLD